MVSPSKKRKDRKGRENDDSKGSKGLTFVSRNRQSGVKKSTKSFKPLSSKKFYLDVKNNAVLLKLESKLKSLGAVRTRTYNFQFEIFRLAVESHLQSIITGLDETGYTIAYITFSFDVD